MLQWTRPPRRSSLAPYYDSLAAWFERYIAIEGEPEDSNTFKAKRRDLQAFLDYFLHAVLDQLREEGYIVRDEDIAFLSPARYEHINPYGRYLFEVEKNLFKELRPLRRP